jgi:hypothetical protein
LTTDDIEKTNAKAEKYENSLNGFGNANITSSQADVEGEEDDNEYYRNLLIKEANKIYSPRQASSGSHVQGNRKGKPSSHRSDGKKQLRQDKEQKDGNEEKHKKPVCVQKYHDGDLLAEAVIVGRKPYFAVATPKVGNPDEVSITLQDSIQIDENTVMKPYELGAYVNKPYSFKSEQEFHEFVLKTKNENLDTMYKKVKSIWGKYVDADDFHISICAADTIFTYFQDKIGLTHYLFFVGGNNSGKSNNLVVMHFISYRNMMSSGMTAANVYQFLGSGEEGPGTICEDEADNIDQDFDKMKVYKNGYTTGIPYHRTDTSVGRQQLKFNTFCFKAFAAERLPDSVTAKGFNQRTVELPCTYGFPKYDISEVVNPAGEEEYQHLLDELVELRNVLLIYRLLRFKEKIPNIKLNIQNREKQLFKPVLRVFQNTQAFDELRPVIGKYISQRRESNANSLHAFLYRTVKELIEAQNTYELESGIIWNTVKDTLQGSDIRHRPQSYDSTDFGVLSQKEIIQTLKEVFGANTPKKRHGNSRALVFDKSKLERLSKIYDLDIKVQVVAGSSSPHLPHSPHVGLDRHMQEQSDNKGTDAKGKQMDDNSDRLQVNSTNITPLEDSRDVQPFQQVAEATEAADVIPNVSVTEKEQNKKIIAEFIEENNLDDAVDKLLSGI